VGGPTDPVLRPATPDDVEAIAAVWAAGWIDGHHGHVPEALGRWRTAPLLALRVGQHVADVVVADAGGEVVGFVLVDGDEVEQCYVAAAARGTGAARALLADAECRIAALGHDVAWLSVVGGNTRARRFYEREGWVDTGSFVYEALTPEGPLPVAAHRYEKPVRPR